MPRHTAQAGRTGRPPEEPRGEAARSWVAVDGDAGAVAAGEGTRSEAEDSRDAEGNRDST